MPVIQPNGTLYGELSVVREISGGLTIPPGGSAIPIYEGAYEITPLAQTDTVMETKGKRMTENVTVLEIPYYETTNESGGYTVIIG